MTTPNLELDELVASQSQPHVPINSSLRRLDAAVQLTVLAHTNHPPVSPTDGDRYIVGTNPDGDWVGHDDEVAAYVGVAWEYLTPQTGWMAYVQDPLDTSGAAGLYVYGSAGSPASWEPFTAIGGSTIGRHAVYVPASGMSPSNTGGCASLATIASAANQPDIQTLDFDTTTQEYAQFSFRMPKSWDEGTVTFVPVWSHASTTTNFGVVWDLQAVAVSNDDGIAVAFGTAQTSTDTGGTTNDIYVGPESSAITVSGSPASEDMVFFRLSRVTGNGSDTMAIDARLHGVTVYITTSADTDA
jgi:hypothetical protein